METGCRLRSFWKETHSALLSLLLLLQAKLVLVALPDGLQTANVGCKRLLAPHQVLVAVQRGCMRLLHQPPRALQARQELRAAGLRGLARRVE